MQKSYATGFGAARISNDEIYRGTWERSRQSQHLMRPQPPPRPARGDSRKGIFIHLVKMGRLDWAFQTRRMTYMHAWSALRRRVPV